MRVETKSRRADETDREDHWRVEYREVANVACAKAFVSMTTRVVHHLTRHTRSVVVQDSDGLEVTD